MARRGAEAGPLPLTRTNLANLSVRIPAGFKREAQMPLIDACGFVPCN